MTCSRLAKSPTTGFSHGPAPSYTTAVQAPRQRDCGPAYRRSRCLPVTETSRSGRDGCSNSASARNRSRSGWLTAADLGAAVQEALATTHFRDNAEASATRIGTEDGAGQVLKAVEAALRS